MLSPQEILDKMLATDAFSHWLQLQVKEIKTGYCCLEMEVRPEMLNGVGTLHGGVIFSAADSAFAFACNSQGFLSVALSVTISFMEAGKLGDTLSIIAQELHIGNKTGYYDINIYNQNKKIIANFKGTCYRTQKNWETL